MGNFNEYQKGMPELGKTYWQDIKGKGQKEDTSLNDIVEINCKTIFDEGINIKTKNPSIFKD